MISHAGLRKRTVLARALTHFAGLQRAFAWGACEAHWLDEVQARSRGTSKSVKSMDP
jgi:hypothetical protein